MIALGARDVNFHLEFRLYINFKRYDYKQPPKGPHIYVHNEVHEPARRTCRQPWARAEGRGPARHAGPQGETGGAERVR